MGKIDEKSQNKICVWSWGSSWFILRRLLSDKLIDRLLKRMYSMD